MSSVAGHVLLHAAVLVVFGGFGQVKDVRDNNRMVLEHINNMHRDPRGGGRRLEEVDVLSSVKDLCETRTASCLVGRKPIDGFTFTLFCSLSHC